MNRSSLRAEPAEKMEDSQALHSRLALYTMARRLLEEGQRVRPWLWFRSPHDQLAGKSDVDF
jgi:hypothetical protein